MHVEFGQSERAVITYFWDTSITLSLSRYMPYFMKFVFSSTAVVVCLFAQMSVRLLIYCD
jgi:hypothetical protein